MSRFARRRKATRTVDLLIAGDGGQPEITRVTLRRINNAQAAVHGLERLLVMADVAKAQEPAKPAVVTKAERIAAQLAGIRSDLTVYSAAQQEQATAHIAALEAEQQRARSDGKRQALAEQLNNGTEEIPGALVRLLLQQRDLLRKKAAADHAVAAHEAGRLAAMARSIGKPRTQQAASDRAAIVCAAVTHHQSLIPNPQIERRDLDPDNPTHWIPHPETPQPEPVQLTTDRKQVNHETGIWLLSETHTSSEIALLAEVAYLHAVGGEEGRAALSRFRRQPPTARRDVSPQQGQGAVGG